jgi:hypothetical protein
MANANNQTAKKTKSKNNPNLIPDTFQDIEDTQSEFAVNEVRAERRENENKIDEQASTAPAKESNAAETESEFSVHDRLCGKS